MSLSSVEKLMFTVGVRDLASPSIRNITNDIRSMKQNAVGGFDAIRGGAFGLAGAGFAIRTFMQPVYDYQRAVGEVKSLGVVQREINALTRESLKFSMQYGEGAADVVRSSYDIQSAIGGLVNGELAKFTIASNVLAKATKADAATITNYMGTMYGIFEQQALSMGKANWVKQLTGQTALAVKMFKTDGANMAAAFGTLGANATASGISLAEQMAVLGMLQSTMSGSEAATKYKSYLAGVAKAQDKLGLSFTNSHGRMLPMATVLGRITNKFGPALSEMESLQLKEAFGSDEAVSLIKLLMGQTNQLTKSVSKFNDVAGMQNAIRMAKQMVDPWDQFHATTEAVRIGFGTALMPTINQLLLTMAGGLSTLTAYTQEFPNLTFWVGALTLGMLGLSAVTGLSSIVIGLVKTGWAAFSSVLVAGKAIMLGVKLAWFALTTAAFRNTLMMGLQFTGWLLYIGVLKMASGVMAILTGGLKLLRAAFLVAFSPIGLIVGGISTLVYFVGDALGWWDKLGTALRNTSWGKPIMAFFDTLSTYWDKFRGWFGLGDVSADISQSQTMKTQQMIKSVGGQFTEPHTFLPSYSANDIRNFSLVNNQTDTATTSIQNLFTEVRDETRSLGIRQVVTSDTAQPDLAKQIIDGLSGSLRQSFGDVYIDAQGGMSPENLESWQLLSGG